MVQFQKNNFFQVHWTIWIAEKNLIVVKIDELTSFYDELRKPSL